MGLTGADGPQGPQGPQGDPGPVGTITQMQARCSISTTNPLTANTDTQLTFGSVTYDDMSVFSGGVNCNLTTEGDYLMCVYVGFGDATAGLRELWVAYNSGGTTIARTSRQSVAGSTFYVDLSFPIRIKSGVLAAPQTVNVYARSAAATSVATGAWTCTRMGAGPKGDTGSQGIQGVQGQTGSQGAQGPAGTASTGFSSYALILPH